MLVALERRTLTTPRPRTARLGAAALLVALFAVIVSLVPSGGSPPTAVTRAAAAPPIAFVANAGQVDARARYVAQGAGYSFFFTDDGVRMTLARGGKAVALELGFAGASARPVVSDRMPATVSYIGRASGLSTFGTLTYPELWPGIDMVLRGDGGSLKYEFHIAPGADPSDIALAYRGANGLTAAGGGTLAISTAAGTLTDGRPVSYQPSGAERAPVESRYRLDGGTAYGFALPAGYDRSRPLVIDPGLAYSTFVGAFSTDEGAGIAVDGQGFAYVAGPTSSTAFPATLGAYDTTYDASYDVAVMKLSPDGSQLVYATFIGAAGPDQPTGIAVDAQGSAYVTGITESSGYPTTPGAADTTYNGSEDAFVTKLTPSGSGLAYSTFLGGSNRDAAIAIAVDPQLGAYITGRTESTGYPTTAGAYDTSFNQPGRDAFVTKLSATGGLAYSSFIGGTTSDAVGIGIAVDRLGSAYVGGETAAGFPTTAGAFDTTYNGGGYDAFITKLTPSGAGLAYSTYLGASGSHDEVRAVAVDAQGAAYVTGQTQSTNFPVTPGAFDPTHNGIGDAFAAKLAPTGAALTYSTFLGGNDWDLGAGIAVDGLGNAHLTGHVHSANFPTTASAVDTSFNGGYDAFATTIDASGATLVDSTFLGSPADDMGHGIAVGGQGDTYVTGFANAAGFPTTPSAYDTSHNGNQDIFVTKLGVTATGPGFIQLPGAAGCVSSVTAAPCIPAHDLGGARAVLVSPDGKSLYVAGGTLAVFDRDPVTGAPTQKAGPAGCFSRVPAPAPNCTAQFPATAVLTGLAITPDGRHLFVADFAGNQVTVFDRDPAGVLTPKGGMTGCVNVTGASGCATAPAMDGPLKLAVSPDGRSLYVAAARRGSATALSIDPAGGLTPVAGTQGCVVSSGAAGPCSVGRVLDGAADVVVDPAGATVYVSTAPSTTSPGDSSISVLRRDPVTGGLVPFAGTGGCVTPIATAGCLVDPVLGAVPDLAIGGKNGPLYAAVANGGRVLNFDRLPSGGLVALAGSVGCISSGPFSSCGVGRGFGFARGLASTSDGDNVYVVGEGIVELIRAANGSLSQGPGVTSCWVYQPAANCTTAHGLFSGMQDVAGSPDDRYFYVPGPDGEVSIYRRDTGKVVVTQPGPVGGTVPATLSLTLGQPATFGAFTPGVSKDYTASTVATVTSTAGSAELRVHDPSPVATGHLVNGAFALRAALQAQATSAVGTGGPFADVGAVASPTLLLDYPTPVSNDAATVFLKQSIAATDALRTGAYGKTLTFTLSSTSP